MSESEKSPYQNLTLASAAAAEDILRNLAEIYFSAVGIAMPAPDSAGALSETNVLLTGQIPHIEARYQTLIEQIPAIIFMLFLDGGLSEAYVSPQIEALLGFTQKEWVDDPVRWYRHIHPDDKMRWSVEAAHILLTGEPLRSDYRILARDGHTIWFHCDARMVRHPDGRPWFIHGVAFDITELKRTEGALRESEVMLRGIFEFAPDSMVVVDRLGRIVRVNAQVEAMFGYSSAELTGASIEVLLPERFRSMHIGHRSSYSSEPHLRPMGVGVELFGRRKDGSEFPVDIMLSPMETASSRMIIAVVRDMTERKRAEEEIKKSLREKETLLQEVHHRVKNNLQVISSLLNLQSGYIQDSAALALFKESQDRVSSMALVHESLYRSEDFARVDFGEYIRELTANLFSSYGVNPQVITLRTDIKDIALGIDTAIPCGLIINELVSNALKYAFTDRPQGEIHITLRTDAARLELIVGDNGVGLPEGFDRHKLKSLGLRIVMVLTQQLNGVLGIHQAQGVEFRLSFPSPNARERGK